MADAIPKVKLKSPHIDRLNPKYAAGDDRKKKTAEAFAALNTFIRKHGGSITSPPGRFVRIECPRGSALPDELRKLGYSISDHGSVTRVTGAAPSLGRAAERTNGVPSAFAEMDVISIALSGK